MMCPKFRKNFVTLLLADILKHMSGRPEVTHVLEVEFLQNFTF